MLPLFRVRFTIETEENNSVNYFLYTWHFHFTWRGEFKLSLLSH